MNNLQIHIKINPELYLKNPNSSELGRKIVSTSTELIYELGFEAFTFKKLSKRIGSPESSIYRYFKSKHTLLVYLTCCYWSWIEYMLVFATANVESDEDKLKEAIKILTQPIKGNQSFFHINEVLLGEIIITESAKAYYTKEVDKENKKGYFRVYKGVVKRVSEMVLDVNPSFECPHMLISTVIEGAHHQRYFAKHLPSLTNISKEENAISKFYTQLVFKVIKK